MPSSTTIMNPVLFMKFHAFLYFRLNNLVTGLYLRSILLREAFLLVLEGFLWCLLLVIALDSMAISDINQSLVRDPENMWAFRNKGIYFFKAGDMAQAERYLLQSAEAKNPVPQSFAYLAKVYHALGREAEAAKALLKEVDVGHH